MCQNCQNKVVGKAPFRVDHVGSYLRPKELVEAREKFAKGELSKEELTKVEDKINRRTSRKTNCCRVKRSYRRRVSPCILAPRLFSGDLMG